jgi:hypothetical protein
MVSETFFQNVTETLTELLEGQNLENLKIAIHHDFLSVFKFVLDTYCNTDLVHEESEEDVANLYDINC